MNQKYALIRNGEIKRLNITLPLSHNGVSIPKYATPDQLRQYDLYPVIGSKPVYDPALQTIQGPSYSFDVDRVLRVWTITDYTEEELQEMADKVAAKAAEEARIEEIEEAKAVSGLSNHTLAEAETWITDKIDGASSVAEIKQALKLILLRMVRELLK